MGQLWGSYGAVLRGCAVGQPWGSRGAAYGAVLCGCAVVQVMAVLGFGTSELSFYLSPLLPGRDSANSIS